VVHDGDFKSGSSPCTDELFDKRYRLLQTFKHPLVFIVDKPLPRPDPDGNRRTRMVNFTRVENFGSPDVHWVRGIVDPRDPELFSFKPELLR
jgi:hypothetical protein